MAVQAHHYPLNAFSNGREEQDRQLQHQLSTNLMRENPFVGRAHLSTGIVLNEPKSELICNASGCRKRAREIEMFGFDQLHCHQQQQKERMKVPVVENAKSSFSTMALFFESDTDQANDSGPASSGGGGQDLESYICNQNLDLEAIIRLQHQKLRVAVEESRKRHCLWLVRIMEQRTLIKLEEKERELQKVKGVNVELAEKVKQMSAENQMWFNMAKNSETTVFSLRQNLVQLLLYNNPAGNHAIEGFGETEDADLGDDAQSRIQPVEESKDYCKKKNKRLRLTNTCKGCGRALVSVLVLPCRHLCLCKDCESRLDCCPVCNSIKNATLHVILP